MGGKGRRRREKNFKAAHGGSTRLPPPPDPSQVDALPSKLRQLNSFTSHASDKADQKKMKIDDGYGDSGKKGFFENVVKEGSRKEDSHDEIVNGDKSNENRKKKKRKRKQAKDLRFEAEMGFGSSSKRKDRKKKYLEAKKTIKKKGVSKDDEDFLPRHEKIEFGDVVKAPPKLVIHKRDMTYEEKLMLSAHLENLPQEELNDIVEIIKKRNSTLSQHDDEIEVDIDSVDAETLWELDRFVTNFKKSLSKNKRKAERALVGDNASSSSSSESRSSSSDSDSDSSSSSESDEGHSPRT